MQQQRHIARMEKKDETDERARDEAEEIAGRFGEPIPTGEETTETTDNSDEEE